MIEHAAESTFAAALRAVPQADQLKLLLACVLVINDQVLESGYTPAQLGRGVGARIPGDNGALETAIAGEGSIVAYVHECRKAHIRYRAAQRANRAAVLKNRPSTGVTGVKTGEDVWHYNHNGPKADRGYRLGKYLGSHKGAEHIARSGRVVSPPSKLVKRFLAWDHPRESGAIEGDMTSGAESSGEQQTGEAEGAAGPGAAESPAREQGTGDEDEDEVQVVGPVVTAARVSPPARAPVPPASFGAPATGTDSDSDTVSEESPAGDR